MAATNSTPKVNKHHPDLTGEHFYGDLLQLIFFLVFLAIWIADSFFMHFSDISTLLPLWLRLVAGSIVLIVSGYVANTGLKIVFGTPHTEPKVIDYGVFKWVRHPIYMSAIGLYLGLLLIKISIAASIVWVFAIILYYGLSRFEEKLLLERFGDDYALYMTSVPMLLPFIRRGK